MPCALVVEDNAMNRKLLHDILELEFEVIGAESAEEASEVLATTKPDVIFLDMQLPGIDGVTFAHRLKENPATQTIPIVAVSAHAMQENIDLALDAGCVEYITKPITEDPVTLARRMAQMLQDK